MLTILFRVIYLIVIFCGIVVPSYAFRYPFEEGLTYIQENQIINGQPLVINIITANISLILPQASLARSTLITNEYYRGKAPLAEIAASSNIMAAINGDYFGQDGDPISLMISGSELISDSLLNRVVIGITNTNTVKFSQIKTVGGMKLGALPQRPLLGINRPLDQQGMIILTPRYGELIGFTSGNFFSVVLNDIKLPIKANQTYNGTVSQIGFLDKIKNNSENTVLLVAKGQDAQWLE